MKITIIGWYGTETIGDRAILAGLISLFNKTYQNFEIQLGSLYPFFSERTLNEDYAFYKEIIGIDFKFSIFNSKKSKELNNALKHSDVVLMGGGPLMDLDELFMVEYVFKRAKKLGIKTALLGCGVGPLFQSKYQKSVLEITLNSDLVILRDTKSKENLKALYQTFNMPFNEKKINTSYDPAVECVLEYNKITKCNRENYIAINLREFPREYNKDKNSGNINIDLEKFVSEVSDKFEDREIRLIPMHYFHIGTDDRVFLNKIAQHLNKPNITVQNSNLTLKETIQTYQNAYFNIGMRFHSVVLQSIASGRNYILDYTEPRKGKISGFLMDIDKNSFYTYRYTALQGDKISMDIIKNIDETFTFDNSTIEKNLVIYLNKLKELST